MASNIKTKEKTIEVVEEWQKGWVSPDIFLINKKGEKVLMLQEHTLGEVPFVLFNMEESAK